MHRWTNVCLCDKMEEIIGFRLEENCGIIL